MSRPLTAVPQPGTEWKGDCHGVDAGMEKEEDDPAGGVEEQDAGIGTRSRSGKEEETRVRTPPPPPLLLLSALPQEIVRPCRRHHRCPQEGRNNPIKSV